VKGGIKLIVSAEQGDKPVGRLLVDDSRSGELVRIRILTVAQNEDA